MADMHLVDISGELQQKPIRKGFGRQLRAALTNKYLLIAVVGIVLFAFGCTVTRGPGSEMYGDSCFVSEYMLQDPWDQKRGFPMTAFNEHFVCGGVVLLAGEPSDGSWKVPAVEPSDGSWKVSAVGLSVNVVSAAVVASLIVTAADRIKRKKNKHVR